MAPEVAAAWIGGLIGLAGGGFALFRSRVTENQRAKLQRQLDEDEAQRKNVLAANEAFRQDLLAAREALRKDEFADKDALREYVYEAKKRLYTAVKPTMFQLTELADAGLSGITCLNDPSRRDAFRITEDRRQSLLTGGFIGTTSYEVVSTAYALLCPLAIFRVLQRKMTTFDLGLDRQIYAQWCLVRASYQAFQRDQEIAQLDPPVTYAPGGDWRHLRVDNPRVHWWQGVSRGRLDNAIDLLIVDAGDDRVRLGSYGEFERQFKQAFETRNETEKVLGVFANPLFDYDPMQRPVFFRIMAVQAILYRALFQAGTRAEPDVTLEAVASWLLLDGDLAEQFANAGGAPIDELQRVTAAYLHKRVLPAFIAPHLAAEARTEAPPTR